MKKYRIVLADDHPMLTAGLKMTIDAWEEFDVVGVAANGEEAVRLCREQRPDLVIMDMQMPLRSGPDAVREIRGFLPAVRVLALTTFEDAETVSSAMAAGCNGFLLKVIEPEKLRASLLSVAGGMNVYDASVMEQFKKSMAEKAEIRLSEREVEILRLVSQGKTNAEIAEKLSLRAGTIKNIVSLLFSKTSCVSRAQLARYAMEKKLVE